MSVPELQPGWTLLLFFNSEKLLRRVVFVPTDIITEPMRYLFTIMEKDPSNVSSTMKKDIADRLRWDFPKWYHEFGHYCINVKPEPRYLYTKVPRDPTATNPYVKRMFCCMSHGK